MSSKELLQSPENFNWEPTITFRVHHLRTYNGSRFMYNIRLYSPLNFSFRSFYLNTKYISESTRYQSDAFGAYGTPEYIKSEQAQKSFDAEFKNLPDDAVALIGLPKDGLCNSCPIGKHCDATNYVEYGRHLDAVAFELKELAAIHKKLTGRFQEGVDFKLVPATEQVLDYQGQNLWTNSQPPIPRVVEYNALLVKMVALRKII